jgi:hypothetical protein
MSGKDKTYILIGNVFGTKKFSLLELQTMRRQKGMA